MFLIETEKVISSRVCSGLALSSFDWAALISSFNEAMSLLRSAEAKERTENERKTNKRIPEIITRLNPPLLSMHHLLQDGLF
jgi:hypothetical protein